MSLGTSQRAQALATGQARLWLVAIGVDRYDDVGLADLRYSALDCRGASEALADATQSFPQRDMHLLCDGVRTPTITAARTSLQKVASAASELDTVAIYFSGHGVVSGDRTYLCLTDTELSDIDSTALGLHELLAYLDSCPARQQLVWLDACHSGSMSWRGSRDANTGTLEDPIPQMMTLLRQRAASSSGFYAMLSCDRGQQAREFPQLGHGVFTYFLMRGLRGEAADERGTIEADGLYRYVYHNTIRYIDKANQQLRLIEQQQRSRGATQVQPEYPLQTPKRIVEGVGELIIGLKPPRPSAPHPRQAAIADGIGGSTETLALGKTLQGVGQFELKYWPQPGCRGEELRATISACLQVESEAIEAATAELSTALLYLRGRVEIEAAGEPVLVLGKDVRLSRSWLRRQLKRSRATHQVVILELLDLCDRQSVEEWLDDLQLAPERGQALLAFAPDSSDAIAPALARTLAAADTRTGLTVAEWIVRLQEELAGTKATPHIGLSGMQGAIEVLPGDMGAPNGTTRSPIDLGLCPYVGLRAFAEADAPYFYGREELTQRLIGELQWRSTLAVVGASGSGKSSVVRAGLMAQLRHGKRLPGSDRWWLRSFRPGAQPLSALVQCLLDSGTDKERAYQRLQLEGMLYEGADGFVRWLRSRPEPMVVLVVDQLEELFTLAPPEDRQRILETLLGAVEYASDRFKLVVTLRTDFVAMGLEVPKLAPLLQETSIFVPPHLSDDDYRRAIVQPAEAVGLDVEPELVEVVLQDLDRAAGDLPLLEFVLTQLWESRQPGRLALQVYQQDIGGLKGALERSAQATYESLDAEARDCARWIFLSLAQLGDGTADTRRRAAKSELIVPKYPEPLVDRTLQVLTAAKLVVVSAGEERWQRGQHRSEGGSSGPAIASPALPSQPEPPSATTPSATIPSTTAPSATAPSATAP
ncbi:MAG: caspase family protein, partial [Cyanobacteria bacterium J06648_11]